MFLKLTLSPSTCINIGVTTKSKLLTEELGSQEFDFAYDVHGLKMTNNKSENVDFEVETEDTICLRLD